MLGNIIWKTGFAQKDDNLLWISITKGNPLTNAMRYGETSLFDYTAIENQEGLNAAYREWLDCMIKLNVKYVTDELDRIAWDIMEGKDVVIQAMEPHTPSIISNVIYKAIGQSTS